MPEGGGGATAAQLLDARPSPPPACCLFFEYTAHCYQAGSTDEQYTHTEFILQVTLRQARFVEDCVAYLQNNPSPARDVFTPQAAADQPVSSIVVVSHVLFPSDRVAGITLIIRKGGPLGCETITHNTPEHIRIYTYNHTDIPKQIPFLPGAPDHRRGPGAGRALLHAHIRFHTHTNTSLTTPQSNRCP